MSREKKTPPIVVTQVEDLNFTYGHYSADRQDKSKFWHVFHIQDGEGFSVVVVMDPVTLVTRTYPLDAEPEGHSELQPFAAKIAVERFLADTRGAHRG